MKATELLQVQHREIERLLEECSKTSGGPEQKEIRDALSAILVAHTTMEEEIFYPHLRAVAPSLVDEALEQHGLADYELARLLSTRVGQESFAVKIQVLAEVVRNHIHKEETEIFAKAHSDLNASALESLGDRMEERFEALQRSNARRLLERALVTNMPKMVLRASAEKKTPRRAAPKKKTARGAAAAPTKRMTPRRETGRSMGTKMGTKRRAAAGRKPAKSPRMQRSANGGSRAAS